MVGWIAIAFGQAPVVEIDDANRVVGTFWTSATPELAREKVADPEWVVTTDDSGSSVTTRPDGACLLADQVSPSTFKTVEYTLQVDVLGEDSFSYEEDTVLQLANGELFHHTDANTLTRVG
mgnify:CR=1 FL=1